MPIPVKCTCGKRYQVADEMAGKLIFCPNCELSLDVPEPDHMPTVDEVEVLEEEEETGEATYGTVAQEEGVSTLAAAAAGGFGGALGVIKTNKEATCLAFAAGNKLGLAGIGRDVIVLEARTSKKIFRFEGHEDPVTALAFSPDVKNVLSADRRGGLLFWQVDSGKVLQRIKAHRGQVMKCAIAPNGKYAISGGEDGLVKMWDLASGQPIDLLDAAWNEPVTALTYSHDGKHIMAGSERGRINVWSVKTGERVHKLRGGKEAIECLTFSYDNLDLVAAAFAPLSPNGMMAWRWIMKTGESIPTFSTPSPGSGTIYCLALYPFGQKMVAGSEWEEMISQGGGDSHGFAAAAVMGGLIGAAIYSAATSARGAYTEPRCGLQCVTIEGGVRGQKIHGVHSPVVDVVISTDGSRALAALQDGDLAFFSLPP